MRKGQVQPLDPVAQNYLEAFEDWLHNPTPHNLERRLAALALLFIAADFEPRRPHGPARSAMRELLSAGAPIKQATEGGKTS